MNFLSSFTTAAPNCHVLHSPEHHPTPTTTTTFTTTPTKPPPLLQPPSLPQSPPPHHYHHHNHHHNDPPPPHHLHKRVDSHDSHVGLVLGIVHQVQVYQLLQLQVVCLHAVDDIRKKSTGGEEGGGGGGGVWMGDMKVMLFWGEERGD